MSPDEIKKWLAEDEYKTYKETEYNPGNLPTFWGKVRSVFESLASVRAKSAQRLMMLVEHEWCSEGDESMPGDNFTYCIECYKSSKNGHAPGCKWAQAMKEEK